MCCFWWDDFSGFVVSNVVFVVYNCLDDIYDVGNDVYDERYIMKCLIGMVWMYFWGFYDVILDIFGKEVDGKLWVEYWFGFKIFGG